MKAVSILGEEVVEEEVEEAACDYRVHLCTAGGERRSLKDDRLKGRWAWQTDRGRQGGCTGDWMRDRDEDSGRRSQGGMTVQSRGASGDYEAVR